MRIRLLPLLLIGIALGTHIANAAITTFADGTFSNSNWTLGVAFNSTAPGESGQSASQSATGGNPGSYRSTTLTFGHGSLVVSQLNSSSVYDPAQLGAITSIDFSYDFLKIFPSGTEGAIYYSMAILQGGVLYGLNPGEAPNDQSWTTHSFTNLIATNFSNIISNPPQGSGQLYGMNHPDFSATAAPLQFGYLTGNDNPSGPSTSTSGIDNWSVTVKSQRSTLLNIQAYAGFEIQGGIGQGYRVEYANSLPSTNWLTLTNITLPYSPYLLIDTTAPISAQRYYRAVELP